MVPETWTSTSTLTLTLTTIITNQSGFGFGYAKLPETPKLKGKRMSRDRWKHSLTLLAVLLASSFTAVQAQEKSVKHAPIAVASSTAVATKKAAPGKAPRWSKDIKTPYRSWIPTEKPLEVLLCVHGLGFSSASFSQFGRVMAGHGMAVYAMDVRGFGAWVNRKGEAQVDFEACLSDVEAALRVLRKTFPGVPVTMVGESMGGAIALAVTSRHPDLVDGLISSVPSSDRYAKLSSEIVVGSHYLEGSDKTFDVTPEVVDRITTDPKLRAKMETEPLNRMKLSPKELKQFDTFMKGNIDCARLIDKAPVLMGQSSCSTNFQHQTNF
jgi:alpha-beta hydrolase superfamily lysophospholipase